MASNVVFITEIVKFSFVLEEERSEAPDIIS